MPPKTLAQPSFAITRILNLELKRILEGLGEVSSLQDLIKKKMDATGKAGSRI